MLGQAGGRGPAELPGGQSEMALHLSGHVALVAEAAVVRNAGEGAIGVPNQAGRVQHAAVTNEIADREPKVAAEGAADVIRVHSGVGSQLRDGRPRPEISANPVVHAPEPGGGAVIPSIVFPTLRIGGHAPEQLQKQLLDLVPFRCRLPDTPPELLHWGSRRVAEMANPGKSPAPPVEPEEGPPGNLDHHVLRSFATEPISVGGARGPEEDAPRSAREAPAVDRLLERPGDDQDRGCRRVGVKRKRRARLVPGFGDGYGLAATPRQHGAPGDESGRSYRTASARASAATARSR